MRKKLRDLHKAAIWEKANMLSRWHVCVDRAAKWVLKKADHIKNENLRLWTKGMIKALARYKEIDEVD